jgi:trans-aconitate 2-methyltransferase
MADAWNPTQYERFREQRAEPFFDLLSMVEPGPSLRALDLGSGTGELTRHLHEQLRCRSTLGVDASPAMLAKAAGFAESGLSFAAGRIESFEPAEPFELVFSNAALQWVDDHPKLFSRLRSWLAPGGQLALQMPANHRQLTHRLASELAQREPFASALAGYVRQSPLLSPEAYAELLYGLGFERQRVELRVYGHVLESRRDVVEWVKGSLLTDYERRLPAPLFAQFLEQYREQLLPQLSEAEPYFFPFTRLLLWARA